MVQYETKPRLLEQDSAEFGRPLERWGWPRLDTIPFGRGEFAVSRGICNG